MGPGLGFTVFGFSGLGLYDLYERTMREGCASYIEVKFTRHLEYISDPQVTGRKKTIRQATVSP